MTKPLLEKTPEELLKILEEYESMVGGLYEYITNKLPGVKKKAIGTKLDQVQSQIWRIEKGERGWTAENIKQAVKLVNKYEELQKHMYDYIAHKSLTDLQLDEIAQLIGFKNKQEFRKLKHNPFSWSHTTLKAALELAKEWNKI
ncbi:hypothetical protein [Ekhidna sp.]